MVSVYHLGKYSNLGQMTSPPKSTDCPSHLATVGVDGGSIHTIVRSWTRSIVTHRRGLYCVVMCRRNTTSLP